MQNLALRLVPTADTSDGSVLGRQVVAALLRPTARIAAALGTPLKDLGRTLEVAYFREVRNLASSQASIAEALGVSVRKVAALSRSLKRELIDGSEPLALTRRVEFLLWSEPLTEARISQALPEVAPAEVSRALRALLEEGRVKRGGGRTPLYTAVRTATRLVDQKGWLSRLDGLHSLLETLTEAVAGRFFRDDANAFARNVQLRVRPQDLPRLRDLYQSVIFPALAELDAAGNDDPEALSLTLALLWAAQPHSPPLTTRDEP